MNRKMAICMTAAALLLAAQAFSQGRDNTGQGRAVVTVLSKQHGEPPASVSQQDVSIKVNGKPSVVASWAPLRGPDARLELVILIDSSSRTSLGSQYSDIEHFVNGLPPNVKVGIAYMLNGSAVFAGPLSADHTQALRALHLPGGSPGSSASPYFCLSELAKHWPSGDRGARLKAVYFAAMGSLFILAETPPTPSVPAEIVVTVGHYFGPETPPLTKDNLTITWRYEPMPITNLIPLRATGLELFLLVDNCSSCEPGTKFEELRRFIVAQPATTAIGVAYIRNGRLEVAETPTQDRERAVKALSVPQGNKPSNPYDAVTDLIQSWGKNSSRHVILMFTSGIDPAAQESVQDPSVEAAIAAAQRAHVAVYAMYHPRADYLEGDLSKISAGQTQLAHLAMETGGEAYFISFGPLPSLSPFLADLNDHLSNQYLLQFLASPAEGPGALEQFMVKCNLHDVELMVPDRAWVPGRKPGS